jgi:hypothetical protein
MRCVDSSLIPYSNSPSRAKSHSRVRFVNRDCKSPRGWLNIRFNANLCIRGDEDFCLLRASAYTVFLKVRACANLPLRVGGGTINNRTFGARFCAALNL